MIKTTYKKFYIQFNGKLAADRRAFPRKRAIAQNAPVLLLAKRRH